MKTGLVVGVIILLIVLGCFFMEKVGNQEKEEFSKTQNNEMLIKRIDGCQYLVNYVYRGSSVYIHKGNCDNPIHVYNKVPER